jgi:hypothetical protein
MYCGMNTATAMASSLVASRNRANTAKIAVTFAPQVVMLELSLHEKQS